MDQIKSLTLKYERNPILRALIQLVPMGIGSAIDSGLVTYLNNIRTDRLRVFFDELNNNDLPLTEEDIHNEDFLHAYFSTTRAALNTRRREKIQLLGRFFNSYINSRVFDDIDAFEEQLSILDDLQYREFMILVILNKYESNISLSTEINLLQRADMFWNDFLEEVSSQLGINITEINVYLTRINRTGLYQTITGNFWGYGGDKGHTTPLLDRLLKRLNE